MSGKPKDDSPAFPVGANSLDDGMSLRDYFAIRALAAIVTGRSGGMPSVLARDAYQLADAMLYEREKQRP